ncbi:unnamed protein product, partial [Allacma fusca]
FLR